MGKSVAYRRGASGKIPDPESSTWSLGLGLKHGFKVEDHFESLLIAQIWADVWPFRTCHSQELPHLFKNETFIASQDKTYLYDSDEERQRTCQSNQLLVILGHHQERLLRRYSGILPPWQDFCPKSVGIQVNLIVREVQDSWNAISDHEAYDYVGTWNVAIQVLRLLEKSFSKVTHERELWCTEKHIYKGHTESCVYAIYGRKTGEKCHRKSWKKVRLNSSQIRKLIAK